MNIHLEEVSSKENAIEQIKSIQSDLRSIALQEVPERPRVS